jgi:hypothetical protein
LLTDLTTAGDLTVPAESPPSNKREREDSDNESPQPSSPPTPAHYQRRSASIGSPPHPPIQKARASDISPRPAPFTSLRNAAPVSLPSQVPATAVKQEAQPYVFGHSVAPAPPSKTGTAMVIPQPYSGSYMPLGGSSGLGITTQAFQSSSASQPAVASFGSNTSPISVSGATGLPSSPPGIKNAMLATYGFSASTPPSAPASVSSNASSPQSGFQPSNDFGTSTGTVGASGGVVDMQGMEMEFGGYGVPMADKEAALRHFAPAISEDGQIGVDRDTMMMWSAMPLTLECVSTLYISPFFI